MRGLEEVPYAARLLAGLPGYLRRPLSLPEAHATLAARLASRERALLSLVRRVTSTPAGAYSRLLAHASCEHGDVERLVRERGPEGALGELAARGVYLTVDEFKGRTPVRRGSLSFDAGPALARNPLASRQVAARSSGSRGHGTHVHFGLPFIRDCAVDAFLHLEARGGLDWVKATWEAPGAGAMFRLLKYSAFGAPAGGWFTPVDPTATGLHPRYRLAVRATRVASLVAGRPLPAPTVASVADPLPLARWLSATLAAGRTPHVLCLASAAVRLALTAAEAEIDIEGAQLIMAGEPVTEARRAVVERSGAVVVSRYGSIETGPVGYACLRPRTADDVHVLGDLHAVIHAGPGLEAVLPADALLVTTLVPTSPFLLLNVSMGDRAVLEERPCGCAAERRGWTTHLREIRSFEKLTGAGVTFLGSDVVRVLEEDLPARFGGVPTDYQLVEGADEHGLPRVSLIVHPRLGPLDERRVAEELMAALSPGDGGEHLMGVVWRQAGILSVERRSPVIGRSGKTQHLVLLGATEAVRR
ncbi:MAG TPA: hypothetical protein VFR32_05160 [Gaiellaceae bacterium]|nr:hypothetical protein [Gaiellaceae bacterium]